MANNGMLKVDETGGSMQLFNKNMILLLILIILPSCKFDSDPEPQVCPPPLEAGSLRIQEALAPGLVCVSPLEAWSLWLCNDDGSDCAKQYYVKFELHGQKVDSGEIIPYYYVNWVTPIIQTSGQIALGDDIWAYGGGASPWYVDMSWYEPIYGSRDTLIECDGKFDGDVMSGKCTHGWLGTWKAQKGLVDLENGSFEKDIATGRTRLYFRAWTENATSAYITADFIDGRIELVKCDEAKYYIDAVEPTHILDVWKISSSPTCSTEGYYEFPSTTSPLVVKTHIVKEAEEIVREKTITEASN